VTTFTAGASGQAQRPRTGGTGNATTAANSAPPNELLAGIKPPLMPAAPPSPKVQAITFALDLAKLRSVGGIPGERVTTADQLITDAKAIAAYIGPSAG
jgi:hypothetical protein